MTTSTIFRSSMALRALPAAFSLLLIGGTAHAAEGFYILASGGVTQFDDDTSKSEKDAVVNDLIGGHASSSQDERDSGYKLQVGYQFNDNFAVEGGYIDFGEQLYKARTNVFGDDIVTKLKTTAKGWNVDAVLILPVNAGFSLFAKLGVIDAKVKQKVSVSYLGYYDSETESATKLKPKAGIGLAYNFWQGLSARAEIEHYSKLGDDDDTGEINVNFYSLGLSYQF